MIRLKQSYHIHIHVSFEKFLSKVESMDMDHGHGTVICLKLKDFMQFSNMVEFRPGPMLNVVVGPNGSGKSSLVNGIALALGSKTNVLGRAQDIGEFIRIGQNQAELEIELLNALDPDKNYKIYRKIIR